MANEFRRGGNAFERAPHQADVAEQLHYNIISTNASFETYSADYRHKCAVYNAMQVVQRESYYGAGGRVLTPDDTLNATDILAINAYGNSNDISNVAGVQYAYDWTPNLLLTIGSEYQYNRVEDNMPGYQRSIRRTVGTWGSYAQIQWLLKENLTILAGGRFDRVGINSRYVLSESIFTNNKPFPVAVPRLAAMYNINKKLKIRISYAQGYRAPQAFDEDLHIATVGGAARFIQIEQDFDIGMFRDAGYVYGPMRPRTFFMGLKVSIQGACLLTLNACPPYTAVTGLYATMQPYRLHTAAIPGSAYAQRQSFSFVML